MHRIAWPLAAAGLALAGCGYYGGPLPPLANVPGHITDLAAVQRDSAIIVQFTLPTLTTEGIAIKQALKLDLRIGTAVPPFNPEQWASTAQPVTDAAVAHGIARYELPSRPWTGREVIVAVRAIGQNGKASGWSNFAIVPVVPPPETPSNATAEAVAAGVRLSWNGRGDRFRIYRRPPGAKGFAAAATIPEHEWIDREAEFGKEYAYLIQALVDLGNGKEAESAPSPQFTITPVDKFPPAVPTGLHWAAAPNSIGLAWERNTEPDLAGYRVYRAPAGGDFERLAEVSQIPTFTDRTVEPGKPYRYAISAFDNAGNESVRSAPVEAIAQ